MTDFVPITTAAAKAKTSRFNITRWIASGQLKSRAGIVNRRPVVLVSLPAVRKLAATSKPGRPKKEG